MAVNFEDRRNGFNYKEVVEFINTEIIRNGGNPDFYEAHCSQPWSHVEHRLHIILSNSMVSRHMKRAIALSALALCVRETARQQWQHLRRLLWFLEQGTKREASISALDSKVRTLRAERRKILFRLRRMERDLQQVTEEREELRIQLLEVKTSAQWEPWPTEVHWESPAQQQRNKARHHRGENKGVMEMPPSEIYTRGLQAATRSRELVPRCDRGSHMEKNGALNKEEMVALTGSRRHGQRVATMRSNFTNPSGRSWSQGDSRKQPKKEKPCPLKGSLHDDKEAPASWM